MDVRRRMHPPVQRHADNEELLAENSWESRVTALAFSGGMDDATALRVSEILGLMWLDLDFADQVIEVKRAYVWARFTSAQFKGLETVPTVPSARRDTQIVQRGPAANEPRPGQKSVLRQPTTSRLFPVRSLYYGLTSFRPARFQYRYLLIYTRRQTAPSRSTSVWSNLP